MGKWWDLIKKSNRRSMKTIKKMKPATLNNIRIKTGTELKSFLIHIGAAGDKWVHS
jgi:hypothetical protein